AGSVSHRLTLPPRACARGSAIRDESPHSNSTLAAPARLNYAPCRDFPRTGAKTMTVAQEMELAHWLAPLRSDEPEQSGGAVSAWSLSFPDAPDVPPALVSALGDVDPAGRRKAAQALASRPDEAVPLLVEALQKEEREPIREALLNALAYLGTAAKP